MRPAKHRIHPRHQFARVERLHDVIVGADFKADDAVKFLTAGGEQDHRDVVGLTDMTTERQAVLARHHDVEDDEVDAVFLDRLAGGLGAVDGSGAPPVFAQELRQGFAYFAMVVDDQDMRILQHH